MLAHTQLSLSRKYLIYHAFSGLWFSSAVWLYFYRLFINDREIGFLDGLAFVVGLLFEVPSGALADRFGRGRIAKLGLFLSGGGLVLQAFSNSFETILLTQALIMIGVSFTSGADEALFFEKLNFDKSSVNWRKLVTRGSQIGLITTLFATISGAWAFSINAKLPMILSGLGFFAAVLSIWSIKDEKSIHEEKSLSSGLLDHLVSIKNGFQEFLKPKLFAYVPIILIIQGLFYAYGWGLLRLVLLDRFTFSPLMGSFVIALSTIITVGVLSLMHARAEQLKEKRIVITTALLSILCLIFSLFDIGYLGFVVILMLNIGEFSFHPFMSEVLNNRAESNMRATVLSVASFLRTLPYVALAPIIGYLNKNDNLEFFLLTWALLISSALVVYLKKGKNSLTVRLGDKAFPESKTAQ